MLPAELAYNLKPMSHSFYQPWGASELYARYAFLERMLPGARVLEVGAVKATGGRSAAFLRQHGARWVLSLDHHVGAIEDAQREYAADADLRFRADHLVSLQEEPFDLVLVADASPFLRDQAALKALARLTGERGQAVLGLRNPAGPNLLSLANQTAPRVGFTYGEMLQRLREVFTAVEMATQSVLVGYRLAPVENADTELVVDGTLDESLECSYFVALCGSSRAGVMDQQLLMVLPAAPLVVAAEQRVELAERLRLLERDKQQQAGETQASRSGQDAVRRQLELAQQDLEAARSALNHERNRARAAEDRADAASRELYAHAKRYGDLAKQHQQEMSALREKLAQQLASNIEEKRRLVLAEKKEAQQGQSELIEALEAANHKAARLERHLTTLSALERSARLRADQAEAALAAFSTGGKPAGLAQSTPAAGDQESQLRAMKHELVLARKLAEERGRTIEELRAKTCAANQVAGGSSD